MTTKATLGPRMGPFATDAFGGSTTPCREWPENERYGKGWNGKTVTISRASSPATLTRMATARLQPRAVAAFRITSKTATRWKSFVEVSFLPILLGARGA